MAIISRMIFLSVRSASSLPCRESDDLDRGPGDGSIQANWVAQEKSGVTRLCRVTGQRATGLILRTFCFCPEESADTWPEVSGLSA